MSTATPSGSASVTVTYDGLGRMVENNAGGSYKEFIYGPTGVKLAQMNGSTLVKALVALPGGAKAIYNSSGLAYFRHSDWIGSSRLTSTATAPTSMYSSSAYAPFGEQYQKSGTADASFTGQDQDTVSSLYDFPARRQSSSQGRWVSPDPAGIAAVNPFAPQTWNRYNYVNNNPLAFIDPTGLDPDCGTDQQGSSQCGGQQQGTDSSTGIYTLVVNVNEPYENDDGNVGPPLAIFGVTDNINGLLTGLFISQGGVRGPSNKWRTVHPLYEGLFSCDMDAPSLMQQVEGNFSQFANYQGSFSALGVSVSTSASFSPGAVTQGGTIDIQNVNSLGNSSGGQPAFFSQVNGVSVTVSSVSSTSFTFDTNPGHVLYPASITFSAADSGTDNVDFSIQVNGDFANYADNILYNDLGGQQLENNIWNNFLNNVQRACTGNSGK
jgi:RHS repeat-associated protein